MFYQGRQMRRGNILTDQKKMNSGYVTQFVPAARDLGLQ
jgi:hypothetical protein